MQDYVGSSGSFKGPLAVKETTVFAGIATVREIIKLFFSPSLMPGQNKLVFFLGKFLNLIYSGKRHDIDLLALAPWSSQ